MEGSQIADSPVVSDPEESALVDGNSPGVHWSVSPAWRTSLIGPQGLRLDEWLAEGRVQLSSTPRIARSIASTCRSSFFLKHYRVLAFLNAATHLLRGSAARREWRNALEVRRRNVPTVTPIALGEHFRHGLVRDSYFVSEAIPASCTVGTLCR